MKDEKKNAKIKITKNGPYIVSGNVHLSEKIITPKGHGYELIEGRELPQAETYALCRCGKSENAPFCDGSHEVFGFSGEETASTERYEDRAEKLKGKSMDLLDDHRCALARFCHTNRGNVWELTLKSDDIENKKEAIKAAGECIAGRLVATDKEGNAIEPELEPSIEIIQDSEKGVSAGIFVKGNIPIESSDGETYEIRNRVALCRCGKSDNKPFCDATHVSVGYLDNE